MQKNFHSLKSLTNQQLHRKAKSRGQRIRTEQAALVEILAEMIARKSYLEFSHSLVGYLETELGLPRTTAYHYSQAAYLADEIPALVERLASGELSVYVVSQVAKAVREREKPGPKNPLSTLQKELLPSDKTQIVQARKFGMRETRKLLDAVCGKTQAEAEREIAARVDVRAGRTATKSPAARRVPQGRKLTRLELTLSDEELALWDRMLDLMAHRAQDPKSAFMRAVDDWLERNDPIRKEERAAERRTKKGLFEKPGPRKGESTRSVRGTDPTKPAVPDSRTKSVASDSQTRAAVPNSQTRAAVPNSRTRAAVPNSRTRSAAPDSPGSRTRATRTLSSSSELFNVEQLVPNDVPIPEPTKRQVHIRDEGACQYPINGGTAICGQTRAVDIDHIVPRALGGGNEPENLRVLCRAHNRNRAQIE
jgi:5-methylcytosine-specific restriction endonuclease McrA